MTEVEKKIEEASENFKLSDIPYPPLKNIFKAGCKYGYTMGREAMLEEVLEYLRSDEATNKDNDFSSRNDCMMDRTLWVKELESKFKGKT